QIVITEFGGSFGFDYGATYDVEVRVMVAGAWSPYSSECQFSIVDLPLTSVQSFCDMTIPNVNSKIYFYHIPQATNYRYSITNAATNVETFIETTGRFFILSTATNFDFGSEFLLKCQVKINGEYGAFGEACLVSTPSQITQLRAEYCGITVATLDSNLYANNVVGAEAYKFRAVNGGNIFEVERPDSRVTMSMFGLLSANTSYAVSVAVKINDMWSDYGTTCLVQTPAAIILPTLRSDYCDATLSSINTNFYATITFGATAYRFKTMINGEEVVVERDESRGYLSMFAGVVVGQTYAVQVASYLNGAWSAYGAPCDLSTLNVIPTTELRSQYCNSTVAAINSNFYAKVRVGATAYKFKTTINGEEVEVVRTDSRCFMSAFSGAETNQTYNIQVAVQFNGVWGEYGNSCALTVGTPSAITKAIQPEFSVKAYPNPFKDSVTISMKENQEETTWIILYDMMGKQLQSISTKSAVITIGESLPTGVYQIHIQNGTNQEVIKLVKN
uniref:T9SS type A sorting domain-containing protein n=1 Tax=Flavobacterium sp. TaxID=239 RepID=UPI004049C135